MYWIVLIFCFFPLVTCRYFTVDYENDCFVKDGKPFRYVSGSIHYFRVPSQLWHDRIYKMKMAGLNAIQTYVEWSQHEPEPGVYTFENDNDLPKFLQTAKDLDMLVILRTGPFIDAERDMGGFPYWLLRINPNMKFRSYNEQYLKYVNRWYSVLLPKIEPFLYNNGGPIITIQIENEYGSTGLCDAHYKSHLRDLFRHYLKNKVVLFTTDGSADSALTCGNTDQVLSTFDFGTGVNVSSTFELLRWHRASGPLVNSEFYPGWLDHWGAPHANVSSDAVTKTLKGMLQANASVNIYMFHGGTSFGFTAGSNLGSTFQACPTSYDYDAPLSEAGDPTPKYYAIRNTISEFLPVPPGPVPTPAPKMETSPIKMKKVASIFTYLSLVGNPVLSTYPLSFEDLTHPYGFVLYHCIVKFIPSDPAVLTVKDVADRAYVYVNNILQGVLSREQKVFSIPIQVLKGQRINILVENQGRVCFGSGVNDRKGIFQNVTLGSQMLVNWTMTPVPLDSETFQIIETLKRINVNEKESSFLPSIYSGEFTLPNKTVLDTFLRVDGWNKGVAFLNGFNLGRYWPVVGPQITLYAPSILFNKGPATNQIILLELEHAPCESGCTVRFVKTHVINGTTPSSVNSQLKFYGKKYLRKGSRE